MNFSKSSWLELIRVLSLHLVHVGLIVIHSNKAIHSIKPFGISRLGHNVDNVEGVLRLKNNLIAGSTPISINPIVDDSLKFASVGVGTLGYGDIPVQNLIGIKVLDLKKARLIANIFVYFLSLRLRIA